MISWICFAFKSYSSDLPHCKQSTSGVFQRCTALDMLQTCGYKVCHIFGPSVHFWMQMIATNALHCTDSNVRQHRVWNWQSWEKISCYIRANAWSPKSFMCPNVGFSWQHENLYLGTQNLIVDIIITLINWEIFTWLHGFTMRNWEREKEKKLKKALGIKA